MKVTKDQLVAFYSGDWFLIADSGNVHRDKVYVDDLNLDEDQETWPDVIDTKDLEGVIQIDWCYTAKVSLSGVEFRVDSDGISFNRALSKWIKVTYAKSKTFTAVVPDDVLDAFETFTKEKGIRIKILK